MVLSFLVTRYAGHSRRASEFVAAYLADEDLAFERNLAELGMSEAHLGSCSEVAAASAVVPARFVLRHSTTFPCSAQVGLSGAG